MFSCLRQAQCEHRRHGISHALNVQRIGQNEAAGEVEETGEGVAAAAGGGWGEGEGVSRLGRGDDGGGEDGGGVGGGGEAGEGLKGGLVQMGVDGEAFAGGEGGQDQVHRLGGVEQVVNITTRRAHEGHRRLAVGVQEKCPWSAAAGELVEGFAVQVEPRAAEEISPAALRQHRGRRAYPRRGRGSLAHSQSPHRRSHHRGRGSTLILGA